MRDAVMVSVRNGRGDLLARKVFRVPEGGWVAMVGEEVRAGLCVTAELFQHDKVLTPDFDLRNLRRKK